MRALLLLFTLLFSPLIVAETLVVVSEDSPIESLDEQQVANIFLAKTNRMPDGHLITPMELSNQKHKASFYQTISGKNPAQINAYWTTLIFTGKGKPPREYEDTKALLDELSNNPHAITYLPSEKLGERMRVVYTLP